MKACGPVHGDRLRARRPRAARALRPGARPLARAGAQDAAEAAGLSRAGRAIRSSRRSPRRRIAQLVGEFEKPKFFVYDERICAHGRSGEGAAVRSASTSARRGAISSTGDKVKVESHLCAGCGGCATVCPSGAMTYASPRVAELGARLKRLLAVYARAGGKDAAILFHNATDGRELVARLARRGTGPAGARDPARGVPRRLGRHRHDARRDRLRREPGARARRGTPTPTSTGRRSSARWGMRRRS